MACHIEPKYRRKLKIKRLKSAPHMWVDKTSKALKIVQKIHQLIPFLVLSSFLSLLKNFKRIFPIIELIRILRKGSKRKQI